MCVDHPVLRNGKKPNQYHTAMKNSLCPDAGLKDTGTNAYLRERILGGACFNEGVCDVNHNSLQFNTRIFVCTIMRAAVTVPHIDWF